MDLRDKINASRAAKLAPSKAAMSRSTPGTKYTIVKEADTSVGQSSKEAKVQAATIDSRGEAVPCAPGEADLMDTLPPSSPKANREACKAKSQSLKGAGVKAVAKDPQGDCPFCSWRGWSESSPAS